MIFTIFEMCERPQTAPTIAQMILIQKYQFVWTIYVMGVIISVIMFLKRKIAA